MIIASLRFSVDGVPVGQGRPRFTTIHGIARAYDPAKSRAQKERIRQIIAVAITEQKFVPAPPEVSINVAIVSYRPIPESKPKWFKAAARKGLISPNSKPDCDNVIKLYLDAMNKVVYADDKQISSLKYKAVYSDTPRTEVSVTAYWQDIEKIKQGGHNG